MSGGRGASGPDTIRSERIVERIAGRDASLWKSDAEHQKIIRNSLGWLDAPAWTLARADELTSFAGEVRERFDDVVVLGMGGSSLCSEVLRNAFDEREGWPRLRVLDSTVPGAVAALEGAIDLSRSLFVVASKSGTTTEPQMFYRYFSERVKSVAGTEAGAHFVAVTDPGTVLAEEAERERFLRLFVNPPDIGGRYSALSLFGMVPAALAGIDIRPLLEGAVRAATECGLADPDENPGARLGAAIADHAAAGRDKLTVVCDGRFEPFGLWIEQLVAESTGKEGKGVLPIAQEPLGDPSWYSGDRLFVSIAPDAASRSKLEALAAAGQPVVERRLDAPQELGAEFYVWEFATAVAGALMAINPFDQPNVQEAKERTKALLESYAETRSIAGPARIAEEGPLSIYGRGGAREADGALREIVEAPGGSYVSFMLYVTRSAEVDEAIGRIRERIMKERRVATTAGYGPRFLHSTGQYHKGGPPTGRFIQVVSAGEPEIPIVGEGISFDVLKDAQSLGDFEVLDARGLPIVRIDVGPDTAAGVGALERLLSRLSG
jgi:transaldolase / glucose-6-phosphate isomerase